MKVRPGCTTLAAKEREPMRDSNSRVVHSVRIDQVAKVASISVNFLSGSRVTSATLSTSIPSTVILMVNRHSYLHMSQLGCLDC